MPKSTLTYLKVPQSTSKYPNVPKRVCVITSNQMVDITDGKSAKPPSDTPQDLWSSKEGAKYEEDDNIRSLEPFLELVKAEC